MKAFVLAAGFGTRLQPLTDTIPKPLVPVCNVPALLYTLATLKQAGIRDVIINVHYKSEEIGAYLAAHHNFGLNITLSYEDEILGTGGGVKKCEPLLRDDHFLLINGDILMDLDIAKLSREHEQAGQPATIVIYEHAYAGNIGAVGMKGERIIDLNNVLHTNSSSPYIYAGAALLSPDIFAYLVPEFSCVVRTAFVKLIAEERLARYQHRGAWFDVGNFAELHKSSFAMLEHQGFREIMQTQGFPLPESMGHDCTIAEDAEIEHTIIGDRVVIEEGVVVKNSILLSGEIITQNTFIENSVVVGGRRIAIESEY